VSSKHWALQWASRLAHKYEITVFSPKFRWNVHGARPCSKNNCNSKACLAQLHILLLPRGGAATNDTLNSHGFLQDFVPVQNGYLWSFPGTAREPPYTSPFKSLPRTRCRESRTPLQEGSIVGRRVVRSTPGKSSKQKRKQSIWNV
jgi:hypothetical protein